MPLFRRLQFWWCRTFHKLGWPMNDRQVCIVCGKVHPVQLR